MAYGEIAASRSRVAEQQHLAILQFPAGRGIGDSGIKIHPLRDHGVGKLGLLNLAERQCDAERGCAARERFGAVGIARNQLRAAPVRIRHCRWRQQRAFHLNVMHIGRVPDASLQLRLPHRLGDGAHFDHRADLLRQEVSCDRYTQGEAFSARGRGV